MSALITALKLVFEGKFSEVAAAIAGRYGLDFLLQPYPSTVFIEPNNTCNLRCPMCPTGSGDMKRRARHMSFQEFKSIIDQIKGKVHDVQLCNYGEPFLNKDIIKMIRYATDNKIKVLTSTNGTCFTNDDICLEVVNSGLNYLIITLDGADNTTLSQYRIGADFEKLVEGYKRLMRLKKQIGSTTPTIELQFLVMKNNESQRNQVREIANNIGVDVFCEKFIGLDINNIELVKNFMPNDLSESRYELDNDGRLKLRGIITNRCDMIYSRCVINSDGSVVPCCYDSSSKYVMGNVFDESLAQIWSGKKYNEFRRRIRKNRASIDICNICSVGRMEVRKFKK